MTADAGLAGRERLADWLAPRLGGGQGEVWIEDVRRRSEGFSWLTYTFTATFAGEDGRRGRRRLALRLQPADGLLAPYDAVRQFEIQRAVAASGLVPVAEPLWLEPDAKLLGAPFYVMEAVSGMVPVPGERAPFEPSRRETVGRRLAGIIASLHKRPLEEWALGFETPPAAAYPAHALDRWEEFYEDSTLIEVPAMRAAFAWMRRHPPATERLVFCHGDYRYGNLMFSGARVVAVFDWELAHAGDPLEDLGWTLLPALRTDPALIAETVAPAEFLRLYSEQGGIAIDATALRFWSILAHVKGAAIYLRGVKAFERGRVGDLRMGALGHRYLYLIRSLTAELEAA